MSHQCSSTRSQAFFCNTVYIDVQSLAESVPLVVWQRKMGELCVPWGGKSVKYISGRWLHSETTTCILCKNYNNFCVRKEKRQVQIVCVHIYLTAVTLIPSVEMMCRYLICCDYVCSWNTSCFSLQHLLPNLLHLILIQSVAKKRSHVSTIACLI